MYLMEGFTDAEMFRLSGRMSRKLTAMRLPAAKAKKYGRAFLSLIAKVPPINVEQNVVNARPRMIQFVEKALSFLLDNNIENVCSQMCVR
jgi:hypothetical protein